VKAPEHEVGLEVVIFRCPCNRIESHLKKSYLHQ